MDHDLNVGREILKELSYEAYPRTASMLADAVEALGVPFDPAWSLRERLLNRIATLVELERAVAPFFKS